MHPFQRNGPQRVAKRVFSTACVLLLILNMLALAVQPAVAAQPADPSAPATVEQLARFYKSASKPVLTLGETLTYTIHLEASWTANLPVDVKDPLPPRLDYVPGSANDGGKYDPLTRSLSWTGIPVTPAASVDLVFQVVMSQTVDRPTPTVNTAFISWDGFLLQREAWVTLLPNPGSGQGLQASFKSADPRLVGPGGKVVYTIHLLNDSTNVLTATVTDPVPTPLTYVDGSVSDGGTYDPATHTVTWKNLVVPPDSSMLPVAPLPLTFAALAPTIIPASLHLQIVTNTAEIATADLTFTRSADILLTPQTIPPLAGSFKDSDRRVVVPGEVFTYTIELNNSSPVPVPAVVADTVPTQVTYVDGSANADGAYDPATHTLSWTNLTVPAASSLTLTFAVTAQGPTDATIRFVNTADIAAGGVTLERSAWVVLAPNPGDTEPPVVHSVTIDQQDVVTQPAVTLHIDATDNVSVTQMFIKEWDLATTPFPHWQEVQASGWISYQADAAWTLVSQSGPHFVGVWVADAAKNRSRLTRRAIDFASLLLPETHVAQGGLVPYLVYYPASTAVTATLTTVSGSPRLFVWHPANLFAPDESSPISVSNTQVITFETPTAGIYMFLVYGLQASVYDLSIVPGGGPRVPLDWTANPADAGLAASSSGVGSGDVVDMSTNPILPQSGEDPLSSAQDPGGPYYLQFLPSIFH